MDEYKKMETFDSSIEEKINVTQDTQKENKNLQDRLKAVDLRYEVQHLGDITEKLQSFADKYPESQIDSAIDFINDLADELEERRRELAGEQD